MNYTVCLINAEYVEYGTFDNYADELYSKCNECWVREYDTFDQYADADERVKDTANWMPCIHWKVCKNFVQNLLHLDISIALSWVKDSAN